MHRSAQLALQILEAEPTTMTCKNQRPLQILFGLDHGEELAQRRADFFDLVLVHSVARQQSIHSKMKSRKQRCSLTNGLNST